MRGLVGIVDDVVDPQSVRIVYALEGQTSSVEVPLTCVSVKFLDGDMVRIANGEGKGRIGWVAGIVKDSIQFLDDVKKELVCPSFYVRLSTTLTWID